MRPSAARCRRRTTPPISPAPLPISAGFPAGRPDLFPDRRTGLVYYPRDFKTNGANEWNINVQRELGANNVLTVAYVGRRDRTSWSPRISTRRSPDRARWRPAVRIPNLGDGTARGAVGQFASITRCRPPSSGGSAPASRCSPPGPGRTASTTAAAPARRPVQTPYNLALNRGNSTFDVRHNVVLSWTYELPFGKGRKFLNGAQRTSAVDRRRMAAQQHRHLPDRHAVFADDGIQPVERRQRRAVAESHRVRCRCPIRPSIDGSIRRRSCRPATTSTAT